MSGGRPGESQRYFYPRSPCGERLPDVSIFNLGGQFLSTLSLRRATKPLQQSKPPARFLSTLSLRRATLMTCEYLTAYQKFLSTLSLRRATTITTATHATASKFLSTLSLRRATHGTNSGTNSTLFLSTLSLRRATFIVVALRHIHSVISIHALLAESDNRNKDFSNRLRISIHALLAESDLFLRSGPMTRRYFYPRSPCGERRRGAVSVILII